MAFLGGFNSGFASGAQLGLGIRDRKDQKARQAVLDERYQDTQDRLEGQQAVTNDLAYQGLELRQEAAGRQKELAGQQKTAFINSQKELIYKLAERDSQKRIKDAADLAAIIQDTKNPNLIFQTPGGMKYQQQFGVSDAQTVNHDGGFFIHAIDEQGDKVLFDPKTKQFIKGDDDKMVTPLHQNGIKAIYAHFMGLQGNEAMTVDAMLAKRNIATKAQIAKEERGKTAPTSLTPSKGELKAARGVASENNLPTSAAAVSALAGRVKALTRQGISYEEAWTTAVNEVRSHINEVPNKFLPGSTATYNPTTATGAPNVAKPASKGAGTAAIKGFSSLWVGGVK